eukprot:2970374-Lingulodinium_polyedra.AAC.1
MGPDGRLQRGIVPRPVPPVKRPRGLPELFEVTLAPSAPLVGLSGDDNPPVKAPPILGSGPLVKGPPVFVVGPP